MRRYRPQSPSLRLRLSSLLRWTWVALVLAMGDRGDRIRGRSSPARRGQRVRKLLERMGGPALRIGLQLATRLDYQPPEFGAELAKMSDRMEPFPVEHALERLNAICGGDLSTRFRSFDPEPVVSNTVACVPPACRAQRALAASRRRR